MAAANYYLFLAGSSLNIQIFEKKLTESTLIILFHHSDEIVLRDISDMELGRETVLVSGEDGTASFANSLHRARLVSQPSRRGLVSGIKRYKSP